MPAFTPYTGSDNTTLTDALLAPSSNIVIAPGTIVLNASGQEAVNFYDGTLGPLGIGAGLLLTSGTTPGTSNTVGWFGQDNSTISGFDNGDTNIDAVVNTVFQTHSFDATTLSFDFTVVDPAATSVSFDLVFGSDEFPEWVDQFVDSAIVMVNGVNYALFNHDPNHPLSVVSANLAAGYFQDNAGNVLPIEYDGVSHVLKIVAPINPGATNHIKIGIADTGDHIYDSGIILANFLAGNIPGSGVVITPPTTGTTGDDNLTGTSQDEYFDLKDGNDTAYAGAGDDIVVAGSGNDSVYGGSGADQMKGDAGDDSLEGGADADTAVFSGASADYSVASIGSGFTITDSNSGPTSEGTDTLTNVEFAKFSDGLFSIDAGGVLTPVSDPGTPPSNTPGSVVISGIGSAGKTLTATVSDPNGVSGAVSYQWQVSDDNGTSWSNVGADSNTYTVVNTDVGKEIQVVASYTDDGSTLESPVSTSKTIQQIGEGDLIVTLIQLDAPVGASVINPLTTLVQTAIELGLSPNTAVLAIKTVLGLPDGINLQTYDAYAVLQIDPSDPTALAVEKVAVEIAILTSLSDDDTGTNLTSKILDASENNQTLDLADANDLADILGIDITGITDKNDYPEPLREIFDRHENIAQATDVSEIEAEWQDFLSIQDGVDSTSIADLSIHVNQAPTGTATASLADGLEDTAYLVSASDLLQGFSDAEGDTLSISELSADNGVVSDNGDGTFTITPTPNFNGPVELIYTVLDGQGGSAPASELFVIVPSASNDAPTGTATAILAAGTEDIAYTVSASDLLAGFSDVDGDTLSVSGLSASDGSMVDNGDDTFTITPTANFNGAVNLTYNVTDGIASIAATQGYTLAAVNDAPVAPDASATLDENLPSGTVVTTVLATDVDGPSLAYAITGGNEAGLFAIDDAGVVTTTAPLDYEAAASHSLTVTVDDGSASDTATVDVTVQNIITGDVVTLPDGGASLGVGPVLGFDEVVGGAGDDTLIVTLPPTDALHPATVKASLDGTKILIDVDGDGAADLSVSGVEDLVLNGSYVTVSGDLSGTGLAPDTITYVGDATDNIFDASGLVSNEHMEASGFGGADTLIGAGSSDALNGGDGVDSLIGGLANDTLDGGSGADTMIGGDGNDTYVKDDIGDAVIEAAGSTHGLDTLLTTLTSHTLESNVENMTYTGSGDFTGAGNVLNNRIISGIGADTLSGLGGNDTLDADTGNDSMEGALGNDVYFVRDAGDIVLENLNEGTDLINTTLDHTLAGNIENLTYIGSSGFQGEGNSFANIITGGAGNDTLYGAGGLDRLVGGAGNDTYKVGAAGVLIIESSAANGTDSVLTSLSNYTLSGNVENLTYTEADFVTTGSGSFTGTGSSVSNTITGGSGNDLLSGLSGNDTLIGGDASDTLDGGSGNDSLEGDSGTGDDSLIGGSGNDTLDGTAGNDTMTGGAGNDSYYVGEAGDQVVENLGEGTDTVITGLGNYTLGGNVENLTYAGVGAINALGNELGNRLNGGNGSDTLNGGTGLGNDTLIGGGGDNLLTTGDGKDLLTGGAGDDTINGGGGKDIIDAGDGDNSVSGGEGNDFLTTGGGNDTVDGGGGKDTINSGDGADLIAGGDGNDLVIDTGLGDDTVDAGLGNDVVSGSDGNDHLGGGDGKDLLDGGIGNDSLSGEAGNDTLTGGDGSDTLDGGIGNDSLLGGSDNDLLVGSEGNDSFDGGLGDDSMAGGLGNDLYTIADIGDAVQENSGEGVDTILTAFAGYSLDTAANANIDNLTYIGGGDFTGTGNVLANIINGGSGTDSLDGGDANDVLHGNGGADTAVGGSGADRLYGEAGDDSLSGGDDKDQLFGGDGFDVLTGGLGADQFSFTPDELITGGTLGNILDFNHAEKDKISLKAIDAITGGGDDPFGFIGSGTFTGAAGQLHYVVTATGVTVEGDTDGNGSANFSIDVDGVFSLVSADFIL